MKRLEAILRIANLATSLALRLILLAAYLDAIALAMSPL